MLVALPSNKGVMPGRVVKANNQPEMVILELPANYRVGVV
jgi:hypothetical protein